MGLVCFRCGEAHRCAKCQWSGNFSICNQDHKDVVCRKNPNRKVKWELATPTTCSGTANMMTSSHQQFSVPPTEQYLPAPFHPQYMMAPNSTPMTSYSGALRLPSAPAVPSLPWTDAPIGAMPNGSSSIGVSGAYALPSTDGRDHGDVVIGTILVDSFDAHTLFDSGASFSFVLDAFVACDSLFRQKISQPIVVNSAKGDETFVANLVVIPLESFDVILVMDWLSQY
jgi:hypothetical protein